METSKEEKPITWGMVTEVVKLSKLQLRNIVKTGGFNTPEESDELRPELLLRVLTADMLERLAFLKPEQKALILDESLNAQTAALSGLAQLAFADGRYCAWTGHTGFMDLESGETVSALPVPPMETISYNLNELYRRGKHQIEKRNGYHAKRQNDEGAVDEPADLCEHTTDSIS